MTAKPPSELLSIAIRVIAVLVAQLSLVTVMIAIGQPAAGAVTAAVAAVDLDVHPSGRGYWIVDPGGKVMTFGIAGHFGDLSGRRLNAAVTGMAVTPSGAGYWLVGGDGGVFAFGDALFLGSTAASQFASRVVDIDSTATGRGYVLLRDNGTLVLFGDAVALFGEVRADGPPAVEFAHGPSSAGGWTSWARGDVVASGDASHHGELVSHPPGVPGGVPWRLNGRPTSIARTASGNGYWVAASDGGVFAFGDAGFHGSMAGRRLAGPVVDAEAAPDGRGYLLLGADGGVFAFGSAIFLGRAPG